MSDYQPKADDKVMVGEHGPFLIYTVGQKGAYVEAEGTSWYVPQSWLTPAPEPDPDEPTAPGALVRTGTGSYAVFNGEGWTIAGGAWSWPWHQLIRPITVVLADPAEVEQLRGEVDGLVSALAQQTERSDELQRRIDRALGRTLKGTQNYHLTDFIYEQAAILRGES